MELLYQRCCGLDVHKKMLVACLITPTPEGKRHKEVRTFRTVTSDLLALLDWLTAAGCSHVAMEATGVYWKPIYNILEGHMEQLVVNAQHIKAVPGRKTDVKDAEWIADLLQHGLLKSSFIPSSEQRELRDLTRYRTTLIEERVRAVNRLHKQLEDTNLKLGDVVSDITGKSAQAILKALLAGESDPHKLADLARGRLKARRADLEAALQGTVTAHHRFMLTEILGHMDQLEKAIERVGSEIEARMGPLLPPTGTSDEPEAPVENGSTDELRAVETKAPSDESSPTESSQAPSPLGVAPLPADGNGEPQPLTWGGAVGLLCSIPGVSQRIAEGILAEIGLDMSRFKTAKHLASWAGMCPGNHESAGKRLSGRTNKGSPWLRKLLIQAAHAASHTKNTYLSAQYGRLAARRGKKRATMAVGHSILVISFHVLKEQKPYQDLGSTFFDKKEDPQPLEKRLVQRLEKLGYDVSLKPAAALAA